MKPLFYLFSLLWCGLFCTVLHAATIDGLYEAELPVVSQGNDERDRVLPLALQQVIIKVTGQHLLDPQLEAALLSQAKRLTQQFRFRNNPEWQAYQTELQRPSTPVWQPVLDSAEALPVEPAEPAPAPYLLWVRFDEALVNQALVDLGLPVWGKERPALLLWLVTDQQGDRQLLGGESSVELQAQVKSISEQRGVPLWLPLLDLEDQRYVTVGDVWGNFAEPIVDASRRYQADVILLGRMQQLNETIWQTRWDLYDGDVHQSLYGEVSGVENGLREGLDQLLDQLALRYAKPLDPSLNSRVRLRIHGVEGLAAYARVSKYLSGLDNVTDLYLNAVSEQTLLVELEVQGDVTTLQQLLAMGRLLRPLAVEAAEPIEPAAIRSIEFIESNSVAAEVVEPIEIIDPESIMPEAIGPIENIDPEGITPEVIEAVELVDSESVMPEAIEPEVIEAVDVLNYQLQP